MALNALERKSVAALAAIYATRMLGLFLLLPVLALYARELPDYSPALLGLTMGAYGLAQVLLQIPFGRWSDRRRPGTSSMSRPATPMSSARRSVRPSEATESRSAGW